MRPPEGGLLHHRAGWLPLSVQWAAGKFKGVNHHDTHPVRGYAMTVKDLLRDIELMKAYHVNCVRTSHYPPDSLMLTMCDVYGLYVVDEADLETHGCFVKIWI